MSIGYLYWLFVKYGALCFGGGYMLVPLFIHDLIEKYHLLSYEEFGNLVAVAQMTPGPVGINTATYIGFLTHGIAGAVIATAGLLTPAVVLVILAAYTFKRWEHNPAVQGLLAGMRPVTLGLVVSAILIFADLSVFSGPPPLAEWLDALGLPHRLSAAAKPFGVRWGALAAAVLSGALVVRKVNVVCIIFGAALFGALFIR